jgi:hypothetical protein
MSIVRRQIYFCFPGCVSTVLKERREKEGANRHPFCTEIGTASSYHVCQKESNSYNRSRREVLSNMVQEASSFFFFLFFFLSSTGLMEQGGVSPPPPSSSRNGVFSDP